MKRTFARSCVMAYSLLCVLCVLCGSIYAQTWKTLKPGVEHAQVSKEIGGLNVNINMLRLDLTKVRIDLVHAFDRAIGMDTTSSIASGHKAFAAINAGFFRLDTSKWGGDAAGIMQINGRLLSEATSDRIQLLINNGPRRTDVYIARPRFSTKVTFGANDFEIKGINRELKKNDSVIFTPEFGPTTLTGNDSVEVAMLGKTVGSVVKDLGNSPIPRDGYIIAATGSMREKLEMLAANETHAMMVRTVVDAPPGTDLLKLPNEWDIIAGVPQLIRDGKIDITWEREKTSKSFVETRHPRTAVAKLKDGKFLMITVDGRTEASGGIGLQDLAEYLLSLGAVDAMNLDGGGSTTMWINGSVVNHPSDKEGERKVSDALIVSPRSAGKKLVRKGGR